MKKTIIEDGDVVFATGVHLRRDTNANGGWVVEGFEDDTYFNGEYVQNRQLDDCSIEYYIGEDEE